MITYPINPSDRAQRRLCAVLTQDLLPISAFTGFQVLNGREFETQQYPFISVQVTECQEVFPRINVWNVSITVAMVEDRLEGNKPLGVDIRPRHELRAENLTARLFGEWNGLSLADAINAIDDGNGVSVLKMFGAGQMNATVSEDEISTEYSFTLTCTTTEQ
jgi:hypothetical protein